MASSRLARLMSLIEHDLSQLPDLPDLPVEQGSDPVLKVEEQGLLQADTQHTTSNDNLQVGRTLNNKNINNSSSSSAQQSGARHDNKVAEEKRFIWLTNPDRNKSTHSKVESNSTTRPLLHLEYGQLGSAAESYCPILEISKYCYKYVQIDNRQAVASRFFDGGKFWARGWDLFYLRHPETDLAIGFVTESQLQDLIDEINAAFSRLDLHIDAWQREYGVVTKFPSHPDCLPRFLGRLWSKNEYQQMMQKLPERGVQRSWEGEPPRRDADTLEAYKIKMDEIDKLRKAKNKATKQNRHADIVESNLSKARQLKRTQRYFGLSLKYIHAFADQEIATLLLQDPPVVNVHLPVPFPFEALPIIIAIDVEWHEFDSNKITEVGICTLDTVDLQGIAPGPNGENWRKYTIDRHIRIKERASLINKKFVAGCPANFEFGKSEFVSLRDMGEVLEKAFNPPYSKQFRFGIGDNVPHLEIPGFAGWIPDPSRNIVLVGHGPDADIKCLDKLGFNPLSLTLASPDGVTPGLLEVLDTAVLYRCYARLQQTRNLGSTLAELDIEGWNPHNAGNDAVYTMYAMLAIAVKDAAERGDKGVLEAKERMVELRIQEELDDEREGKRRGVEGLEGLTGDDGGERVDPTKDIAMSASEASKATKNGQSHQLPAGGSKGGSSGKGRGGAASAYGKANSGAFAAYVERK